MFYFVANFIVKVAHSAYFLVTYRYKYEDNLKEEMKLKKLLELENVKKLNFLG
jgi:hypothetical protein